MHERYNLLSKALDCFDEEKFHEGVSYIYLAQDVPVPNEHRDYPLEYGVIQTALLLNIPEHQKGTDYQRKRRSLHELAELTAQNIPPERLRIMRRSGV